MEKKLKISLLIMNEKGFYVLSKIIEKKRHDIINIVVAARDKNLSNDYYNEIKKLCINYNITFYDRNDNYESLLNNDIVFTIGWRWLIKGDVKNNLIVSHDSLLPKYRGFAPLVNMLINHEKEIGVTFLTASDDYDCGDIIIQKSMKIEYPIKINNAIKIISNLFFEGITEIIDSLQFGNKLSYLKQDGTKASYSLWRDEEDYLIDFNKSANYIKRFVDSVGNPYLGASTYIDNNKVRILDVEVVKDLVIENRDVGKVIFLLGNCPVVVCGKGLICLSNVIDDKTKQSILPLKKFRIKFTGK